jgi:hypothetical protein
VHTTWGIEEDKNAPYPVHVQCCVRFCQHLACSSKGEGCTFPCCALPFVDAQCRNHADTPHAPGLVLDVTAPARCELMRDGISRLLCLVVPTASHCLSDGAAHLTETLLAQVEACSSRDFKEVALTTLATAVRALGAPVSHYDALFRCLSRELPDPSPLHRCLAVDAALGAVVGAVVGAVPVATMQPYVRSFVVRLPASLALANADSLKVQLCRAFTLVLADFPSTRLQLHLLVPFLGDRAIRTPLVAAFRHAVASVSPLLVSSQVLHRNRRAHDGNSDLDEPMEPAWPEQGLVSAKRRKMSGEGPAQGGARVGEAVAGLEVVDQISLETLWPVFNGIFRAVLPSTPPQASGEMRSELQRLDATVRIVLPFCQDARPTKSKAAKGVKGKRRRDRAGLEQVEEEEGEVIAALLSRVGDWIQLTERLCREGHGEAADMVQTLVSLVDEALDFVPGALISPWAQDILHLVELPWKLSAASSTSPTTTTTTTTTTVTTTTSNTPLSPTVMQACLRLLGRLPVFELETELGLLDAALRHDDSHVRAAGVRCLPSFLARIPTINGQRFQQLKRYLKTLM